MYASSERSGEYAHMRICADSPEPSLLADAISTEISCPGPIYISAIQSQPLWWHYLTIIIPDKVDKDAAFMFIAGGSNNHGLVMLFSSCTPVYLRFYPKPEIAMIL